MLEGDVLGTKMWILMSFLYHLQQLLKYEKSCRFCNGLIKSTNKNLCGDMGYAL